MAKDPDGRSRLARDKARLSKPETDVENDANKAKAESSTTPGGAPNTNASPSSAPLPQSDGPVVHGGGEVGEASAPFSEFSSSSHLAGQLRRDKRQNYLPLRTSVVGFPSIP